MIGALVVRDEMATLRHDMLSFFWSVRTLEGSMTNTICTEELRTPGCNNIADCHEHTAEVALMRPLQQHHVDDRWPIVSSKSWPVAAVRRSLLSCVRRQAPSANAVGNYENCNPSHVDRGQDAAIT